VTPTHWQPLAVILGAAVGGAAGTHAAYAAKVAASADRYERRFALTVAAGVTAGMMIGARFGIGLELTAYLLLVAVALPLSAIDIAIRRVPDRIVLPAVPAAIALLALAAHSAGTFSSLGRALFAGVATFVAYLALALATGQLGLGDCKAAGLCGLYLGFLGVRSALFGVVAAFVLAACYVLGRRVVGTKKDTRTLAFAPFIFAGAIITIIAS
jgi:leader peptidase (prepilin peptidase)/N-methyltransferase